MGYVKLTDFGLSKILQNEETAMSICGTPEYLAPEIVKKAGHGVDVDWWCLGCLLHEMITGFPPFRSENRMELFETIVYKNPDLSKVDFILSSFRQNFRIY